MTPEDEFIDFFATSHEKLGMDPLSSKLLGILFIEPKEVSMKILAEKTGYSLASLSTKLRTLEDTHIIKRIKKPGTKKAFYYVEKDMCKIINNKIENMLKVCIIPTKNNLPSIINNFKNLKTGSKNKEKINILQQYYDQVISVENILINMKKNMEQIKYGKSKRH
ncbi:hypothetical protein HQ545_07160 [Candidatus Woesearchaeota archaeon]|nr:hypothetical protein [Candidatus Woesearchaeota archaeon]